MIKNMSRSGANVLGHKDASPSSIPLDGRCLYTHRIRYAAAGKQPHSHFIAYSCALFVVEPEDLPSVANWIFTHHAIGVLIGRVTLREIALLSLCKPVSSGICGSVKRRIKLDLEHMSRNHFD